MQIENLMLNERYRLISTMAEGAMSVIYRGFDEVLQNEVCVKVLKSNATSNLLEDLIRFRMEATAISNITHKNIVKVLELGEIFIEDESSPTPYIIMELIQGFSLAQMITQIKNMSLKDKVGIIVQIAEAIEFIHGKGIIHRDLKPGNIMIEYSGSPKRKDFSGGAATVKIIDFGLARVKDFTVIIDEDMILGTFGYMPPEQSGMIKAGIDERSDLYSLGILSYQLLTGSLPYPKTHR